MGLWARLNSTYLPAWFICRRHERVSCVVPEAVCGCHLHGALAGPPRHRLLGLRLSMPTAFRLQVSPGPRPPRPAQAQHLPGRGAGTCRELGGLPRQLVTSAPHLHCCSLAGSGPLVHRAGSTSRAVRLAWAGLEAARTRTGIRRGVAQGQAVWSWKG